MKQGFTLAEVLLTLAIIGIVATLTIPAVITKVTQDQYVVGLKKAYNTLKAVQREAEQEHGPMENWDWALDSKASFEKYFKPRFDILKDCGHGTDEGCLHAEGEWKLLNGALNTPSFSGTTQYNFVTSDGIAYSYGAHASDFYPSCAAVFVVDVNNKKGPNIVGRDIFSIQVFRKAGIKPEGSLLQSDETQSIPSSDVDNNTTRSCNKSRDGWYCATKVLSEGSMNY